MNDEQEADCPTREFGYIHCLALPRVLSREHGTLYQRPIQEVYSLRRNARTYGKAQDNFQDVFVPIIPVLVATGLFMGLRGLLTQEAFLALFGLTSDTIPANFTLFARVLTDTAFAFLPALVCWSTFRIFSGNPVIGIVIGLMLVNPALPNAYAVGQQTASPLYFFGFIPVVGYQGSVLPAFITGIVGSQIEKFLKKKVPDSLELIIIPFSPCSSEAFWRCSSSVPSSIRWN